MNKKRYLIIIAIMIFIFLALFTFANPLENGEGEPNDNRVLEEIEEDDVINNVQDDTNTDDEQEETPVYNNHGVNVENILRVEDNSYELALNAVVRAEVSLEEEKYKIALDLVSKVTDDDKKEELEERLEIVLDTMELIELVKELVEMTSGAKNLKELDTARDYQVSNEIIDRITKLVNNTLKESLNDEVDTVLYLLKDETAPTINIEDEAILKEVVVLDVKDDNKFTMTLTKEGEESKNVKNGDEVSDGVYTLTVIDESFNEKTITFTIDTVAPEGEIEYSTTEIINGEVVATLVPSETVTVTNNDGSFEYTFEENGSFTFEFVDRAGNTGTATATVENIDKEAKEVTFSNNGSNKKYYNTVTTEVTVLEENVEKVSYIVTTTNDKEKAKKKFNNGEGKEVTLEDNKFEVTLSNLNNNFYVYVKVVDKAGNVSYTRTKNKFKMDSIDPEGNFTYSTTAWTNGEVVATLVPSETVTVTNNDGSFEYTFEENGSFTFEFVDRAGNVGTATATVENIDTEAKGVTFSNEGSNKKYYNTVTTEVTVLEENVEKVSYIVTTTNDKEKAKKKFNNGEGKEVTLEDNKFEVTLSNLNNNFYVYVKVVDKAGNVSYTRTTNKFKMDSIDPEGKIEYSITEWTNGTVVATLVPSETVTVTNNDGSFEYTFEENGSFTFEFVDRAGNIGTATATVENIDTKLPGISIGGTTGEDYWFQEQTFEVKITEENIDSVYYVWNQSNNENSMKRALDGKSATKVDLSTLTKNADGTYTLSVTLNTEGRYVFNVKVVDKAGNVEYKRKGWYQIDRTAPSMQVGDIVYGPEHTDVIYSPVRFKATAVDTPSGINKIYSNGHERSKIDVNGEGNYTFTLVDKAGNTSKFKVIVDKTAPSYNYVGIMNIDQTTEGYAKVGDRVWVYVVVDEHLSKEPTIKINGETARIVQTEDGAKFGADWYKYVGEVVMTEEMSEGEIEFTISGYEDLAGHPGDTLTNANINNGISAIKLDKTAPSYNYVGIMNIDQKTEGYAKVGDRVWVYVVVDEHLSKEPTIKINGETAKIVQTEDGAKFGADWYKYVGEVKMKEEMPEGEIEFTISGYEDLAGLKGDTLTNANINKGVSSIKLDKTAPTYKTYKGKITYDKYKIEPTIIDGELYFFGETTFNFNDNVVIKEQHVDNGVYIGWQQGVQKIFNTQGKHTIKMVDAAGNETSVTFTILDERLNITNIDELKTALNELDEITLYKDLDLGTDNPLLITSGEKVINLNGKKITGKSTKSATSNLIEVKSGASLRLEGNGEISFIAIEPDTDWDPEGFPTYANNTIKNSGKLVIDGPTIKNNTPRGGASYAIDNYPGADLEVLSGTITQAGGDIAIRLFANSTTVATKVTINGGTISGYRAVWIHIPGSNPLSAKLAYLTVNGGVLNSTDLGKNDAVYSYSFGDSFANTNITITGGTFNGDVVFGGGYKGDKENVTITGGTFNGELGRYLENDGWEDLK